MAPSSASVPTPVYGRDSGLLPILVYLEGGTQRRIVLDHTPFRIGRKTDKDLVIADPRVSRDHAEIVSEGQDLYVVDLNSRHGTFVNGERVERRKLERNDRLEFGVRDSMCLVFNPVTTQSTAAREFLNQISAMEVQRGASDLEKLGIFLEAARRLSTTGALDEVLITLVDATLRLTGAERGYVFLRSDDGKLQLAAGRDSRGQPLTDQRTISRSMLEEAAQSSSEFLVTDTAKLSEVAARQSIAANELRTVICIPLRRRYLQPKATSETLMVAKVSEPAGGVLYLDSRFASGDMSRVSHDILRAIATEAAALVENAHLVEAEAAARCYQQELSIAASIQQRLMAVTIPQVTFASVQGHNLSCREIGGDFFDVVVTPEGLALVVADVCGKGISAAILASILQGMINTHLAANRPLQEIVAHTNMYLCQKGLGEKYATLVLVRLEPSGDLEYINCGHVPPLLVSKGELTRPQPANLPVGLIPGVSYESARARFQPGDRMVVVTDGITEAENDSGEFFGEERLQHAIQTVSSPAAGPKGIVTFCLEQVFTDLRSFCANTPLSDDCTVVELRYDG